MNSTETEADPKLREEYRHFRILVIGRANAGKTTLVGCGPPLCVAWSEARGGASSELVCLFEHGNLRLRLNSVPFLWHSAPSPFVFRLSMVSLLAG